MNYDVWKSKLEQIGGFEVKWRFWLINGFFWKIEILRFVLVLLYVGFHRKFFEIVVGWFGYWKSLKMEHSKRRWTSLNMFSIIFIRPGFIFWNCCLWSVFARSHVCWLAGLELNFENIPSGTFWLVTILAQ